MRGEDEGEATPLKFQPLSGAIDVGFFSELGHRKLHQYGLSDTPVDIYGSFARAVSREVASPICLGADAFDANPHAPSSLCVVPGTLRNANTLEDFKEWDKPALLDATARQIWDDISSGIALIEPERLMRFILLTFADLKSHRFYYWFAFPAFNFTLPPRAAPAVPLDRVLTMVQVDALRQGYAALGMHPDREQGAMGARCPAFFAIYVPAAGDTLSVGPLAQFAEWRAAEGRGEGEALLGFADPCPLPTNPGWPLRNLLALADSILRKGSGSTASVRVVCFREPPPGTSTTLTNSTASISNTTSDPNSSLTRSIVLQVTVPMRSDTSTQPTAVGWERNSAGKMGPRMMDLSAQMNPEALAEASVDLNLRLMRWRLMPSLQTEKVAATRCLLMGAGTLGCAVARCLLGWGVRAITFVDSGVVSYSNPVRQTLFNFDDCIGGDTPKAQAAADALKRIFPSVEATAHRIAIPMPGHAVSEVEAARVAADCTKLSELVHDHDVIFLLTDTRESRWLPSLLATTHHKLVINAALGFDSLLVMRHGLPTQTAHCDSHSQRLGCYFCNDVVAPANSMLRRTLDQQCTVSRPGLSMIASAMAVELMVTLLHHPDGAAAAADVGGGNAGADRNAARSPLGCVPHQIRTSLPLFRNDAMVGAAFDKCTACSSTVVNAFEERGFEFLLTAFNRASYLEDLTGLTQMHAETEAALEEVALFDDEDDD